MPFQSVRLKVLDNFIPKEHTSASRLGLFMRCQRWFGFEKLAGLVVDKYRDDGKLAQPWFQLGHEVEYYQQKYLEGYALPQDTEAGRRALSSLHLLPDPKNLTDIVHQEPIRIDTAMIVPGIEKFELRGAKDLVYRDYRDGVWCLLDYKTTRGNTRRKGGEWDYVKTQADLLSDVQANFYAYDLMYNREQAIAPARWVYTLTDVKKHPDARATDVEFKWNDVLVKMRQFLELADWHRAITRQFKQGQARASWEWIVQFINALTPNGEACDTFGGCPYRPAVGGPCKQPSRNLGAMLMSAPNNGTTSIEDMLQQRRNEAGAQAGAPPPYGAPPQGGMMPPPATQAPMAPPQAPPGYAPGTVINGHIMGTDGQWRPHALGAPPPMAAPQAPPHAYTAPPSPVLPPEAYAPPQAPALPPPPAPMGMTPPPPAAPEAPKGGKGKATKADPAEDERRQFMRACVLACSSNVDQIIASNPTMPTQHLAQAIVNYAGLVFELLKNAGA